MLWVRSVLESGKKTSFQFWEGVRDRSVLESGKTTRVFNFGGRGVLWLRSVLESGKEIRVFNFQGGVCYG